MAQITWRNIAAPNMGAELEMAGDAYSEMGSSLDPLKNVIDRRQAQKDDMYDREQENIFGEAGRLGTEAAESGKDITLGSKAVYDSLLAQGMDSNKAMQKSSEWESSAGVLQDRYDKENLATLDNILLNTDPQTSTKGIQQTVEGSGLTGKLADQLRQSLTTEMETNRNDAAYHRTQGQRVALDKYSNNVIAGVKAGKEPSELLSMLDKSGLSGNAKLQASQMALDHYIQQGKLLPQEEAAFNLTKQQVQTSVQERTTQYQDHINNLQAEYSALTGLNQNITQMADKALTQPGGIVGAITDTLSDTSWEPSDWATDLKTSKARVSQALNNKYSDIKGISGINDSDAAGLLWLAYQDTIGESYGLGGVKGVNPEALTKAVQNRMDQYEAGRKIQTRIAKDSKTAKTEMEQLALNQNQFLLKSLSAVQQGNRTNIDTKFPVFKTSASPLLEKEATRQNEIQLRKDAEFESGVRKDYGDRGAVLTKKLSKLTTKDDELDAAAKLKEQLAGTR